MNTKLNKSGENKRKITTLWWACAVLLLCGCSPVSAVEQVTPEPAAVITPAPEPTPVTLRVQVGVEGSTIDPAYLPETIPGDYMGHLFEGLMKYVPADTGAKVSALEVVPGLAETVEVSDDGRLYRFFLREDGLWSDGQPITAGDFVFAWQRLLEVGRSPGAALLGETAASFWAESDRVLSVRLHRVCPWFLKLCAAHYMVPLRRDVIEQYGGDWTDAGHIVVSGAYTIDRWVHDDVMVLVPNPYYYQRDRLGPQVIEWRFGGEADSHVTAGEKERGTYTLCFNTASIRDWRVRAAMVLAVDRAALGNPAAGLVPGEDGALFAWLAERYPRYDVTTLEGRRELARDLMSNARAAGTWHSGYQVYYRVTEEPRHREIARRCIADWQEVLGLQAELVETAAEEYGQVLTSMRFDIAFMEWQPAYDDPMACLQMMQRGGADNHTGWGDVRYDDLLARAEAAMDAAERNRLLQEAEQFLFREDSFALCPLLWQETAYEVNGVTGIGYGGGVWRFQYAALQP